MTRRLCILFAAYAVLLTALAGTADLWGLGL